MPPASALPYAALRPAHTLATSSRSLDVTLGYRDAGQATSITHHLAPIVAKYTLLISDGEKAYGAFAARQGILHVWIIASKGEHVWRGYHIQNVNAYASGLKIWMVLFAVWRPNTSTATSASAA